MDTLVLIDGNSLLNRAFYATKFLSTKSGIPTNAVFGFIKLLLKLIEDIKPQKLIVTFDLKVPTFRHKMYDGYKATRKPMPEELAVQVGMLKELLHSMNIMICEKEGYEADDLIGSLSHMFSNIRSIIVTGDRDSYQLVDDVTEVYLTKTGVSELLKLNLDNFEQIIGYRPDQVIDMKALMGDSSDNIPGVPGVGEKTAHSLIMKYGTLDGVYEHISDMSESLRRKLEQGKYSAYLSKKLATIDRRVPISINLSDCGLEIPFSEEVRSQFLQWEFTSLLKLNIFPQSNEIQHKAENRKNIVINEPQSLADFTCLYEKSDLVAVCASDNVFHFYADGIETVLRERRTLLDDGFETSQVNYALSELFKADCTFLFFGAKSFLHILRRRDIRVPSKKEDVCLMKYLVDYTGKDDDLYATLAANGLNDSTPAYGIFALYDLYKERIEKDGVNRLYYDLELPLVDVLFDMEESGVKIDLAMTEIFEKRYRAEIDSITAEIYEQAGTQFNLNSPLQLGKILFDKLGLPSPKKNKNGSYSTSADILEKLSDDYKIVRDVLRCRHIQKLLSTYIEGFKPLIERKTELVHTTYNQVQTSTGRLSSVNPNLQNIPIRDEEGRELRKLFVTSFEDGVLVDADYSQIELRLLAHFSGCKELIEAYKSGRDIHALTASQVFGTEIDRVTEEQRRAAKAVNFGIIYGISDFGLANNLNISPKQAREYIRRYFERYSDIKEYMDGNVAFARKYGYVKTLLGRKRVINEISSSNYNIRSFGERAAMNMPLQGSSADIIKIAMLRVYNQLKNRGMRSKLILQVHDELVIDACGEEREDVVKILKNEMEQAVQLNVPLIADVHCGKNWYEAK